MEVSGASLPLIKGWETPINTWKGGTKRMEPLKRATLWCPVTEATHANWDTEVSFWTSGNTFYHCENGWTVVQLTQGDGRVSQLGDIQSLQFMVPDSQLQRLCCSRTEYPVFFILSAIEFVLCQCFGVISCSRMMDAMLEIIYLYRNMQLMK